MALACLPLSAEAPMGPETWHSVGQGMLRDDLVTHFWYVDNYEFPVEIQESDQVPGRYRLVNAYANYPLASTADLLDHEHSFVIDAEDPDHVWIEKGCIGLNRNEIQAPGWEYVIWSIADNEYNNKFGDWEAVAEYAGIVWGTLKEGEIVFPKNSLLVHYYQPPKEEDPDGEWTLPVDGFQLANGSGMFRLLLPGAKRYGVSVTQLDTQFEGDDITLRFAVSLEENVSYIRYAYDFGDQYDAGPGLKAELTAGGGTKVNASEADMTRTLVISIPYEADGQYTLAVMPFDEEDNAKTMQTITYSCAYNESEWKKCGEASYTEAILCSSDFSAYYPELFSEQTYNVQVEANLLKPGLIRLVDPYGPPYQWANSQTYDTSRPYYMEIDCTDPDRVHIPLTEDGIGLDINLSTIYVWSRANRYLLDGQSIQEIDGQGIWGSFDPETGRITFPRQSLLLYFQLAAMNLYWANQNGRFLVELPAECIAAMQGAGVKGTQAVCDGPERWYNLQGVEVNPESLTPGIYVVRSNGESRKVSVR